VALLVLALAGTGVGVGLASRNGEAGGAGDALRLEDLDLRVGEASLADIQVTVHEVGTIEPVVRVDVKSTLSGKVTELLVREGDQVRRGQVLARVEPDVNQAQTLSAVLSEKKLAEIRVDDARQDLETRERLYREGYVSDQELKDFRVDLDTALEALDAVRAKMRIVEASGIPLDQEFSTSQRVNIVSPMDGTVIEKNVEVGQTVSSGLSSFNDGTVLYTVADLQAMRIEAAVNEVDIGRVREDMPVVVTVDAFPYRRFEGVVTHISAAARLKDKVRVFDVEVTLNRRVPELRAGMTANIEVRGDRVEHVLSVPVEGIFKNGDRDVVYVVRKVVEEPKQGDRKPRRLKSGKFDVSDVWQRYFEEHPVKVGLTSLERAQILEGLEAGAELALEDPTRPRQIEEE
jgi:RND family efflux transporter MFP subunit